MRARMRIVYRNQRDVHSNALGRDFSILIIPAQAHKAVITSKLSMRVLSNLVRDQFRGRTNNQHSDHNFFEKSHTEDFVKSGHI